MKPSIVGILAAVSTLLGGCGVGVNDPDGEAAMGWRPSAAVQTVREQHQGMDAADVSNRDAQSPTQRKTGGSSSNLQGFAAQRETALGVQVDKRKALPQDPVPYTPDTEGVQNPTRDDTTRDPGGTPGSEH